MPILGLIASSTRQGQVSDTGAVFPITAFWLGSDTATVNITNIPSTYTHLILTTRERKADNTSTSSHLIMNADTSTANYDSSQTYANSTTVAGGQTTASSLALLSTMGELASTYAVIYDYASTNKNKTFTSSTGFNSSADGYSIWRGGVYFGSTAAISSLRFTLQAGANFKKYTSFVLYGVKG